MIMNCKAYWRQSRPTWELFACGPDVVVAKVIPNLAGQAEWVTRILDRNLNDAARHDESLNGREFLMLDGAKYAVASWWCESRIGEIIAEPLGDS
jgi:hypothetical protein